LADAVNTVGRDSYGDGWLGAQANSLMRLTGPIRFRGARTPDEQALVARMREAQRQRSEIFSTVRNNLLGSTPAFEDACPVTLISDADGKLHVLRPEIWINDQEAESMLASGHAFFHPQSSNWRWSPTRDRISGILLIAAADLPSQGELHRPPLDPPDALRAPIVLEKHPLTRSVAATREESSTPDEDKPSGSLHTDVWPDEQTPKPGQRRAAYRGALEAWMAPKQLSILQRMGAAAIARAFESHCEQALPQLMPLLPKRRRSMESVIERIIQRRLTALRTKNRNPTSAGNGK
jgi:hypothetical protein